MIVTTTPSIEGQRITRYRGVVTGEAILGANIFKDLFAGIRDLVGGRSAAYKLSKLMLNGMTRIMAAEIKDRDIKINTMAPGWVRTDMGGVNAPRSLPQGADTIIWLATLPQDGPSGGFFEDRAPAAW